MKSIIKLTQMGVILFIFIISSCSQDLTRTKAKKAIIANHNYPYTEIRGFEKFMYNQWDIVFTKAKYEKLKEEGYISFSKCNRMCTYGSNYCAEILEKGKSFISGKPIHKGKCKEKIMVRVSSVEFGQILRIKKINFLGSEMAEVTYTTKRSNITPFGKILFSLKEGVEEHTAYFTKYDNGWRIEK